MTLAGIYKIDGRPDDAIKTYEKAIALKAERSVGAPRARARCSRIAATSPARARATSRRSRSRPSPRDKEQTLRTLMTLALDAQGLGRREGASTQQLVKLQPTSLFVKGELGRELFPRGEYEKAEAEFKELVTAAHGRQPRARAGAEGSRQGAGEGAQEPRGARDAEEGARRRGPRGRGARRDLRDHHRDLPRRSAAARSSSSRSRTSTRATSRASRSSARSTRRPATRRTRSRRTSKALAVNPRHIDLRLKMIRLLQSQGELDKAIAEYEGLIRAAPNNPQFVFEQCEALMQRGDRARALKLLTELEARAPSDEEVALAPRRFLRAHRRERTLAARCSRASRRSARTIRRTSSISAIATSRTATPPLAVQTWKRILTTVTPRARALAALGDVYLEHDMTADALAAFHEAVQLEPQNLGYKKQLAERARAHAELPRGARASGKSSPRRRRQSGDKILAREARSRIVTLLGLRAHPRRAGPAAQRAVRRDAARRRGRAHARRGAAPPAQARRRRGDAAHASIELAPGDADSYLALERVLVQENKIARRDRRAREARRRRAEARARALPAHGAVRAAALSATTTRSSTRRAPSS